MGTMPFKLINRTESQQLSERLQREVSRWAAEWLCDVGHVQATVVVEIADEALQGMRWHVRRREGGVGVAVGIVADASLLDRLLGVADMVSDGAADSVARHLEDAATNSLLATLIGNVDGERGELPSLDEMRVKGSSYLLACCRIDDTFELRLILWPQTVRTWLGQPTPHSVDRGQIAASRLDALDVQTVAVEVVAGEVEIAFDEFRALCEGVVIKLDRGLDQPLQVRLIGDGVLCAGHLGFNGERRAVQVSTTS